MDMGAILDLSGLESNLEQVEKILVDNLPASPALRRPADRMIRGGKRLRPILLIASAPAGRQSNETLLQLAAAVELVHQSSLVHDDIMDGSKLRRDQPTVFAAEGLDIAILVGDYLLAKGLQLASASSPRQADLLSEAVAEMCEGQAMEFSDSYHRDPLDKYYIKTVVRKAGALLKAACMMGGAAGGLSIRQVSALGRFGENFGVTFQIIDDLLDKDVELSSGNVAVCRRYAKAAQSALQDSGAGNKQLLTLANLPARYLDAALPDQTAKVL
ncbi:MAG TPA: polyprenyl synthetase family protein [Candidatus Saccharimonadales bacterium]|nr:polyprenyl synthetase family protein [Candidatus Saccharimonadales bacterium]